MIPMLASLIPAAISFVTKVAATIGPLIAKNAPMIISTIGKNLPAVVKTVESIGAVIGTLQPEEKVENLGAKAMSADKKPEDFDRINDYIDYIRNDVEVDQEKLSNDKTDVMARQAVGSAIMIQSFKETLGSDVGLPFIKTVSELGLDPKMAISIAKIYADSGLKADDMEGYISDKLDIEDANKHSEALVKSFQATSPSMAIEEAETAVMDLR